MADVIVKAEIKLCATTKDGDKETSQKFSLFEINTGQMDKESYDALKYFTGLIYTYWNEFYAELPPA